MTPVDAARRAVALPLALAALAGVATLGCMRVVAAFARGLARGLADG